MQCIYNFKQNYPCLESIQLKNWSFKDKTLSNKYNFIAL